MNIIYRILRNWGEYKSYRSICAGKKPINMKRGCGYYFPLGIGGNPLGRKEDVPMQSGRTALAELVRYEAYNDPDDMIKESFWHISGYKGEKKFKDMSFDEYLKSAFNK